MGATQQFSLRWNNYVHHITNAFDSLRSCEDLVDVTLVCDRKKIHAHKMLLSACSEYFRDVFKENPCKHPVIIFRNVKYEDLLAIVDFMYHGEVNVEQDQLTSFLTTAEMLAVQGLSVGSSPPKEETRKRQAILLDSNLIGAAHESSQDRSYTPKSLNRSLPAQNTSNLTPLQSPVPSSPPRKRRVSPAPKPCIAIKNSPKRHLTEDSKDESVENVDAASFSEEDGMMDVSELELSREADDSRIKEEVDPDEVGEKLALERSDQAGTSGNSDAAADERNEEYLEEDDGSTFEFVVIESSNIKKMKSDEDYQLIEEDQEDLAVSLIVESDDEGGEPSVDYIYAEGVNENNELLVGPMPSYKCSDCYRVFKRHDSLLKHAKMHAGKTACPLCPSVFSRVGHLTRHVKIKHPDYPMVVRRGRPPRHS